VKVRSKIFSGFTPKFKRCAMRATMVLVLPVPAEAMMRLCPNGAVAAVYCSLFNLDKGIVSSLLKRPNYSYLNFNSYNHADEKV